MNYKSKTISDLIKTADDFEDLAKSKEVVIRNNDDILKEISSKKDFEDRVGLAEEHFDKLGEGSSRTIFQISDSLVLKVAHSGAGIAQNESEMSMRAPCLNNVLAADTDAKWIIVRFSDTMTEEDFDDAIGFGFKPFIKAISYSFNNEDRADKPKEMEEIKNTSLFKCLSKLVLDNQLQIGDIGKISSWGLIDGKPLLRDFGLTKEVYSDFYEGKSGNETDGV